jgi:DNA-binding IclR family transcriptional regulator
MAKDKPSQYFLTTLEKGLNILSLFTAEQPNLSRVEISRLTGINMTSTYRFIDTLTTLGYLRKDPRTKLLELGPAAFALGNTFIHNFSILKIVKPYFDQIHEQHNISLDSVMLYGDTMLLLYRRYTRQTSRFSLSHLSGGEVFHCTSLGKSILAHMPIKELDAFLDRISLEKLTRKTIVNRKKLIIELEQTRKRGYAVSNEEYSPGLIAIGAPIINQRTNRAIGSVSFDFTTDKHTVDSIQKKYAGVLLKLTENISNQVSV